MGPRISTIVDMVTLCVLFRAIWVVYWFVLVYDREDIRTGGSEMENGAKSSEMEGHSSTSTSFLHPDIRLEGAGEKAAI